MCSAGNRGIEVVLSDPKSDEDQAGAFIKNNIHENAVLFTIYYQELQPVLLRHQSTISLGDLYVEEHQKFKKLTTLWHDILEEVLKADEQDIVVVR